MYENYEDIFKSLVSEVSKIANKMTELQKTKHGIIMSLDTYFMFLKDVKKYLPDTLSIDFISDFGIIFQLTYKFLEVSVVPLEDWQYEYFKKLRKDITGFFRS